MAGATANGTDLQLALKTKATGMNTAAPAAACGGGLHRQVVVVVVMHAFAVDPPAHGFITNTHTVSRQQASCMLNGHDHDQQQ